jgi:hypothetical protein
MNFCELFRVRLPAWADWFALLAMALAAPMVAMYFHSFWVFFTDFRLYNAEIGGVYFIPGSGGVGPRVSWSIYHFVVLCDVLAIPTFLVLLPFRRLTLERWIVWAGFIALWVFLAFQAQIAYH